MARTFFNLQIYIYSTSRRKCTGVLEKELRADFALLPEKWRKGQRETIRCYFGDDATGLQDVIFFAA